MLSDSYFQSWYTKVAILFCVVGLNSKVKVKKKKVHAVITDYF